MKSLFLLRSRLAESRVIRAGGPGFSFFRLEHGTPPGFTRGITGLFPPSLVVFKLPRLERRELGDRRSEFLLLLTRLPPQRRFFDFPLFRRRSSRRTGSFSPARTLKGRMLALSASFLISLAEPETSTFCMGFGFLIARSAQVLEEPPKW